MKAVQIPTFETLDQHPSWANNAGNLDRSACVELRVSFVRRRFTEQVEGPKNRRGVRKRRLTLEQLQRKYGKDYHTRNTLSRRFPEERPAPSRTGRQATTILFLTKYDIEAAVNDMLPRRLAGDYRDGQAAAMRPILYRGQQLWNPELSWHKNRRIYGNPNPGRAHGLPPNPNRGASRTKILGLPDDWRQPVRLERWRYPARATPMYYFVCPNHGPDPRPFGGEPEPFEGFSDPRLPRLSTAPPGKKETGCPQRVLFLLLPLCTAEEYRDAQTAWLWLRSLTPHQQHVHADAVRLITKRYGLLFPPRTLLCRSCLHVVYGKDPVRMARWRKTRKLRIKANQRLWVEEATAAVNPESPGRRRARKASGV